MKKNSLFFKTLFSKSEELIGITCSSEEELLLLFGKDQAANSLQEVNSNDIHNIARMFLFFI